MRSLSPSRDSKVCHDVTRVATRTSRIQLARRSQLSRSQMKSNAAGSAVVPGGGTIAPVWYSARARRTDRGPPGPAKTRGTRKGTRTSSDDHRGKRGVSHASRSRGSDTTTAGRRPRNAIGSGHVRAWIARGRTMTTMTTMGALRGRSLVTAECCSGKRRTVRICTSGNDERRNVGRNGGGPGVLTICGGAPPLGYAAAARDARKTGLAGLERGGEGPCPCQRLRPRQGIEGGAEQPWVPRIAPRASCPWMKWAAIGMSRGPRSLGGSGGRWAAA